MLEHRTIPTHVVAYVAGVTADDVRGACCGPLKDFGERIGKCRCFSRTETLKIALAFSMGRGGVGITAACAAVANPSPELLAAIDTQDGILTFWPRRGGGENGAFGYLVKVVVDAGGIVQNAAKRLDEALEAERRHQHGGPAFVLSPAAGSHR